MDPAALAERARRDYSATVGLGIGPVRPAADGRPAIGFAVVSESGIQIAEHVLGGGPDLAGSLAAKSALDMVRIQTLYQADA